MKEKMAFTSAENATWSSRATMRRVYVYVMKRFDYLLQAFAGLCAILRVVDVSAARIWRCVLTFESERHLLIFFQGSFFFLFSFFRCRFLLFNKLIALPLSFSLFFFSVVFFSLTFFLYTSNVLPRQKASESRSRLYLFFSLLGPLKTSINAAFPSFTFLRGSLKVVAKVLRFWNKKGCSDRAVVVSASLLCLSSSSFAPEIRSVSLQFLLLQSLLSFFAESYARALVISNVRVIETATT